MDNKINIEGTVEEIIYANEENGYTVCEISSEGELITLVGIMPFLASGETVKAAGEWQDHPSYGRQLKVEAFEKTLPADEEAIFKYLASGTLKGIGPVTAKRILDKFGIDTFDVIENNFVLLHEVKGITKKRAEEINESFRSQFGARSILMFLNRYFGSSLSVKIYRRYQAATVDIIKANPYRLCDEINGIGFERADSVAIDLGYDRTSSERIESGLKYTLNNGAYQSGHCYMPYTLLMTECQRILNLPLYDIDQALVWCVDKGEIIKNDYEGHDGYALPWLHNGERYIADKLKILSENELPFRFEGVEEHIKELETKYELTYAPEQKNAISASLSYGLSVVTGGPGTGKTTVIRAIIDIFEALKISYMLAAPTGRAAKRMSEASGRNAKTIHRMLEMIFSDDGAPTFARNSDNPLPCKAIIIDEMSMVDTPLMESLLRAIKNDGILVLIGDVDQLPPVGPGNVLNDIITSEKFTVTRLEHIFRQASQSLIVMNAHKINRGEQPELNIRDNDFFFIKCPAAKDLGELISSLCKERLPKTYNLNSLDDIQIITPTRRGEMGTHELNRLLQNCLNPKTKYLKEKRVRDVFFRENDKVMQIKNNYNVEWRRDGEDGTGIFNGDIGRIKEIRFSEECFVIDFDGKICEYDFSLSDELEHAYAITVHKSQGSEYPVVIIPAYRCPMPLMTRNLLYTAVTRARNMLIITGSDAVINQMAKNDRIDVRFTGLIYMM